MAKSFRHEWCWHGWDMSAEPLVLLPPSQAKTPGGRGRFSPRSGSFRRLAPARIELIEALATYLATPASPLAQNLHRIGPDGAQNLRRIGPEGAAKVFGATGELLDHALGVTEQLIDGTAPTRPAIVRYDGVVWTHLAPDELDKDQQARIVVPSAVVGLSAGTDPVPDHRLTFSVSLPELGRLDRWWRPHLTDALIARADGAPVVDLLPNEHAAAIDLELLGEKVDLVRVRFVAADGRRAAGHGAKAVKGKVARAVLDKGPQALGRFTWEGWRSRRSPDGYEIVAP